MTREWVKENMDVLQAFADGSKIEYWDDQAQAWILTEKPKWDPSYPYRFKPEVGDIKDSSYYRGKWLQSKKYPSDFYQIIAVNNYYIVFYDFVENKIVERHQKDIAEDYDIIEV